jgi:CheY-like chemotaxis protein/signal recognition particle receptor subunit beta
MALFNHATKEVTAKVVYYGPGLCGKTTNLRWIHDNLAFKTKGKLVSLATQTDRTLFFDFLPIELGTVRGMRLRVQIYTVPGQVFYEATRRVVLKGCDAVVFVADSQAAMLDANAESLRSLRQNLLLNEIDPQVPQVIQYNKRDLPTALPVPVLDARLNPRQLPHFEAVAVKGAGVEETLRGVLKLLLQSLVRFYGEDEAAPVTVEPEPEAAPAAPAAPAVGPPNTFVFAKPRPATDEPATPAVARPQPVIVPATAVRQVPTAGRPASASVPPPVGFEVPRPAGEAVVFRERRGAASAPVPADPPPMGDGLRGDQWVYLIEGAQRGPVDVEDLVDLVLTSIPEDTKVWHPGLEGWVRANEVREIAEEIPPPLPGPARGGYFDEEMPDFDTVPPMLRTALIADEDGAFRKYLAMPLAAQGFTIYEAADGAAAWQLAVQNRPWMILADISMPEVDGFEFCRRVRSHPLLSRKPVLFISGSDKYKERYRALQIGADDFLSKTMPIRELLMRIQLLMTRYSDLNAPADPKGGAPAPVAGALEGRIEVFGAPALMQICNQGRLSGLFTAVGEGGAASFATVMGFREGEIVSATVGERSGPEAVYAFLGWQKGSFRFSPGDPGPGAPLAQSVEHLLLEGCRLLDESRAGDTEGAGA